ncbi:MAG TPA: hypothetical protein VK094_03460 [Pseudogracilibacillus sp.]|nr:hypothetical protein [Pseudogracilibacillus sp.]
MPSITVIQSIGLLIASFLIGIGYFYIQSDRPKKTRKKQIEVVSSILINIVIYVWVGKVLVNLPKFISDPLAILAYPSNANAFYVASVLGLINIIINIKKNKIDLNTYIEAFIPIFIGASLIFEFINYIQDGTINSLMYFLLLILLIGIQLILHKKLSVVKLNLIITIIWSSVKLVLSLIYSYTTIFNYLIHPIYFVIIIILAIYCLNRKGTCSE